MNKLLFLSIITITSVTTIYAKSNEDILLGAFHKNGITRCDKFIKQHMHLKDSFNVFISKHDDGIDGPSTEVSIITISGAKGKTVKFDDSYIQTTKNCALHSRSTTTQVGSCDSIINPALWFRTAPMPNKDYNAYRNKLGYSLYAKELKIGDSKVCIMETSMRVKQYKKGKEPKRR